MKPAKLNLLFPLLIVILLYCYLAILPKTVRAENKCGVNVGPNYSQVDSVVNLTKSGGWIVALGSPGNCTNFEKLFGKGLNVVIRAYNGGQPFTNEQALGWVATLGKLDTKGQKVYFMPWNEPNHDNECGNRPCSVEEVVNYVSFLKQELDKAGLLNNKVVLLSPMIDKLGPRFEEFKNIYSLTDGSSINAYDQFVSGPCSGSPTQNNCQYNQIGIPAPYYAVETGVAGTCGGTPCYKDDELKAMLNTSWVTWKDDINFKMFAIFSYDPHRSGWDIFSSSQTANFYQNTCIAGGVGSGSYDTATFNKWFEENKNQLVECGGCGYAPSASFCTAAGPGGGGEPVGEPMVPLALGDWFNIWTETRAPRPGEPAPKPETKALIKVQSDQKYQPEPYNNLKGLTSSLTGISQVLGEEDGNPTNALENSGVWERLRLPNELTLNPETQFPEAEGRKVDVYFDCVGETEEEDDKSTVDLDPNLTRTQKVLADLTQRLARVGSLRTTNWSEDYKVDNTSCRRNTSGYDGERLTSISTGEAVFINFNFLGDLTGIVGDWICSLPGADIILSCKKVKYTIAVQPKIKPDKTTAAIPELSYGDSQKKNPDGTIEKFGGGIFRIFFVPRMETIGEKEGKMSQGELLHGKGIQDYYSDWTVEPGETPLTVSDGHTLENAPADDYGLDGTKEAYDYTQEALTP